MAAFTDALAQDLLEHALLQSVFVPGADIWFSLHTQNPTRLGLRTYEVPLMSSDLTPVPTGYGRHKITLKMSTPTGSPPRSVNNAVITIGPATADWGTVNAGGIDDHATVGTMRFFGLASEARTITIGESFQLVLGQFAARFQ